MIADQFQSTHPCRVRRYLHVIKQSYPLFQSTHPCRVRLKSSNGVTEFDHFNPRTRVGCDILTKRNSVFQPLFQSTHPCRVRQLFIYSHACVAKFQSTHPCRVRHAGDGTNGKGNNFNPRTRVGCDIIGTFDTTNRIKLGAPKLGIHF